jgi:hypothetical protein
MKADMDRFIDTAMQVWLTRPVCANAIRQIFTRSVIKRVLTLRIVSTGKGISRRSSQRA